MPSLNSGKIARLMKLNGCIRRMDSLMIESNIRFLRRMELIYTCISKLVASLTKKQPDIIPEQLKHYADPNDYNRIFYHQRNDDMDAISGTCWWIVTVFWNCAGQITGK